MPDFKAEVRERLTGLKLSPAREGEIVEELSQHLEDEYEQALSQGGSEEEARREVMENFTLPDSLGQELRRVERPAPQNFIAMGTQKRSSLIGDLRQDVRYGWRMLGRN